MGNGTLSSSSFGGDDPGKPLRRNSGKGNQKRILLGEERVPGCLESRFVLGLQEWNHGNPANVLLPYPSMWNLTRYRGGLLT